MGKAGRYSPEVRERAVRILVEHHAEHESQWAAIGSIASKFGCSAETLRKWVRQAELDLGGRPGQRQTRSPKELASAAQIGAERKNRR